jgi:NADH:ubiquinone oxidoreductase subunit 4 (subunit M)
MSLEFMTGATVFALINLVLFLTTAYLVYRGGKKLYEQNRDEQPLKFPREFLVVILLGVLFVFFGSNTQPKLSIDTAPNRALIEYQEQNREVVIETPPPRTDPLQGFTPLKQE